MKLYQKILLLIAFASGCLFAWAAHAEEVVKQPVPAAIVGPPASAPGQLVIFDSPSPADWSVTPVDIGVGTFEVDTGGARLYFASPNKGVYTVVAAIVVDSKAKILTHTFNNGMEKPVVPLPDTDDETVVVPPTPETNFAAWVKVRSEQVQKSQFYDKEKLAIKDCLESVIDAIDRRVVPDVSSIQTRITATAIAKLPGVNAGSVTRWNPFLKELGEEMKKQLAESTDVKDVRALLAKAAEGLK